MQKQFGVPMGAQLVLGLSLVHMYGFEGKFQVSRLPARLGSKFQISSRGQNFKL
jgi:hypothetical protein